jgi:hypothetical protein
MRSLRDRPFPKLIASIPVANHAIEVEAKFWERLMRQTQEHKNIHAAIFGVNKKIQLSRQAILDSKPSPQKCIEVLFWGYPTGMRGSQHEHFLRKLEPIAEASANTQKDWQTYFGDFRKIKKLGISTITKLAYFYNAKFENYQALILDDRIIKLLQANVWSELKELRDISREKIKRDPTLYLCYLKTMKDVVSRMEVEVQPAQLEFFLFSLGNSFVDPQLKPK